MGSKQEENKEADKALCSGLSKRQGQRGGSLSTEKGRERLDACGLSKAKSDRRRHSDRQCQKQWLKKKDVDQELMRGSSLMEVAGDLNKSILEKL